MLMLIIKSTNSFTQMALVCWYAQVIDCTHATANALQGKIHQNTFIMQYTQRL